MNMNRADRKIFGKAQLGKADMETLVFGHPLDPVAELDKRMGVTRAQIKEATAPPPRRLIETTSELRKRYPMATGLLDYFPDACAEVSRVSYEGNLKHNPGEPMHHARGKSMDHPDCIMRHLTERGGFDGPIRHSAALAWRALALLQEELEAQYALPLPRGAKE